MFDPFPNITNKLRFFDCSNAVKCAKGLSKDLGHIYLVTKYCRGGYTLYQVKDDCEAEWKAMKATEQVLGIYKDGIETPA